MNKQSKFALTTFFVAVAGYVAGILTAPKSGKETRKDIKNASEKAIGEAEDRLKKLHTELDKAIEAAKVKLETAQGVAKKEATDLIELAKTAKEKVRTALSAVHEGESDDKELQKAINDASKALDHLKKFASK